MERDNKGKFVKGHKAYINPSYKEANGNWKGGKWISDEGIRIFQPNHPYASKKGWVQEHRLVMEQYLGRYITREEIVHHINKLKTDNRIENLMLFPHDTEHKHYHKQMRQMDKMGWTPWMLSKSVLHRTGEKPMSRYCTFNNGSRKV